MVDEIKGGAIRLYRELVAAIGCAPSGVGQSLRQAMLDSFGTSEWWYHPTAFRHSESHPIFDCIAQALAIQSAALGRGIEQLVLCGAPAGIAEVLRQKFSVQEEKGESPPSFWRNVLYGLGSRLRCLLKFCRYLGALRRYYRLPVARYPMVFVSFWDWGFKRKASNAGYDDRYFKRLPEILAAHQQRVGYFAWFDPHMEPSQKGRRLADVVAPLQGADDVVLLQAFLKWADVFRAILDFRSLLVTLRALREPSFRRVFRSEGWDWFPIFRSELIRGSWNASVAICQLVALATERAAVCYRPALTLSFLEHYPHARAHYEGIRRSGVASENWAVQHAGVCHEKTFYFLHPEAEFAGIPDNVQVPHPDRVFVMGQMGRDIFLECGYAPEQIALSGSTRYDHIRVPTAETQKPEEQSVSKVHVLLACSLEIDTEVVMVEAAFFAARDLPQIQLRLRNHPSSRVDTHPRYRDCQIQIEVSSAPLAADLDWANLIVFSYSTVAEEAYLQGKPAWQWLPLGFNGSALAEAVSIPQFGSVQRLREELIQFCRDSGPYLPSVQKRKEAAELLFAPADGMAANRIAAECVSYLKTRAAAAL